MHADGSKAATKFDTAILAIAVVEGVSRIFSDDDGLCRKEVGSGIVAGGVGRAGQEACPARCPEKPGTDSPVRTGGEGGIRTHGTLARTTVFETAPIDRSGTSPLAVLGV